MKQFGIKKGGYFDPFLGILSIMLTHTAKIISTAFLHSAAHVALSTLSLRLLERVFKLGCSIKEKLMSVDLFNE